VKLQGFRIVRNSNGLPQKRFLDKVKLMVIMRDSINRLLNECMYVIEETRKSLIVYGWLC
jgi:hypothetical protein